MHDVRKLGPPVMSHRMQGKSHEPLSRRKRWTRDGFTYLLGVAGIINEAFIRSENPRDALLIFYASCLGFPTIVKLNEKRNGPP